MGILGDKLSYLPARVEQPVYGRAGWVAGRVGGEVRQVVGTPPAPRHAGDPGDQQAAARLASQHFLASPPDLYSRRGGREQDIDTQAYSESNLADNELDSEISSLFGAGESREQRLQNLHLMSPLEYAAMLKQYQEPHSSLGPDITPDSGVMVEGGGVRAVPTTRPVLAPAARPGDQADCSTAESSDSSGSFGSRGRGDSLLQRSGRYGRQYRAVPTQEGGPPGEEAGLESNR